VSWLHKLFARDPTQATRLAEAEAQRDAAVEHLEEARELNTRLRPELKYNHFGERMAAALEPRGWKP